MRQRQNGGGVLGGLAFCATAPDAYSDDLAHQHLAEEQQRTVEARAQAAPRPASSD